MGPFFFPGVAIMLSITIFATVVGEMLPVSDATPLIGQLKQQAYDLITVFRFRFHTFIIENSLNAFYPTASGMNS